MTRLDRDDELLEALRQREPAAAERLAQDTQRPNAGPLRQLQEALRLVDAPARDDALDTPDVPDVRERIRREQHAWAGAFGYRYSGQTLEPRPAEPALAALLARVVDHTRVPFNHVLANRYRDGSDSIGLHADDEPELGPDPVVATLSFGATRKFVLKPRRTRLGSNRSLDVEHGSLLVMGGTCQRHYVQRNPPVHPSVSTSPHNYV